MTTALVYGLAVAGEATARCLERRGTDVIAADDTADEARRQRAVDLGLELVVGPDDAALDRLVRAADIVVPSPGVPENHRLFAAARAAGRRVVSEIELAYEWEQDRPGGPRPMLAVTGTDGKTTTTLAAVAMLEAVGRRAVAAGNTKIPLVTALDLDVDVFVVECTSFRLAWTDRFRGDAAVWLNLAPDHLNWHRDLASYVAAKARIYAGQRADDVAIGFVDDPVVMAHLNGAPGRPVTFAATGADYEVRDGVLSGPGGPIMAVGDMRRQLPHDITNGLAAAALVLEPRLADADAVATALASFVGPPHRIELVGDRAGVRWYDDSKATTPHAASVAIGAFDRVVLIAGGRNKGLDLTPMATDPGRIAAVVAIGEAADEVAAVFGPVLAGTGAPVLRASTMPEAVDVAGAAAHPGDVVVLSPGCASFDWYPDGGYEARGDDFRAEVRRHLDQQEAAT